MTIFQKTVALAAGTLILAGSPWLRALDLPTEFTLDLPFQPGTATPAWVGQPIVPATTFATLEVPIQPADGAQSLLLTVYFQEKEGGFLRITWQGEKSSLLLSDNFYEGTGMANQRRLLIPAEALGGKGLLMFQSSETTTLGISRLKLTWLDKRAELVSPQVNDDLVISSPEQTQPVQDLNGQPNSGETAAWHGQVVNVPITTAPERIEAGVDFSVEMAAVPEAARLKLQEAGLPLGQSLVVWINQQRAGTITPTVPDLQDGGYESGGSTAYTGWLPGTFYVPASLLKAGTNTLQFSTEPDPSSTTAGNGNAPAPLAVKDVSLQLRYAAPTGAPASAPPATTLTQIP